MENLIEELQRLNLLSNNPTYSVLNKIEKAYNKLSNLDDAINIFIEIYNIGWKEN